MTQSHPSRIGPDGRYVYFFGGDSAQNLQNRQYLNDIAVLDTKDWVFAPPTTIAGQLPRRRSTAVAGIITNNYLIVGFGKLAFLIAPSINSSQKKKKIDRHGNKHVLERREPASSAQRRFQWQL